MEVGGWLLSLGLEQYEVRFREHEIDAEVLSELVETDLEKLGIPLGHRKRLLKAIRALQAEVPASQAAPEPITTPASDSSHLAERRQLTVMFCDLVGSTALSTRLDPEDLRGVIGTYHRTVAETVRRFDGFVARYMGDGVLVYFGYPRAHEDDAERAVRAALDVVAAVERLAAPQGKLEVRIGIATGLVVVGDLIGEGVSEEHGVVGDTPNLAARLQTLAQPRTIVVPASTRSLLGNLFKLRDLGRHELKGFVEPVEAWAVEGVSVIESRFELMHSAQLSGFVGREAELGLLMDRWSLAQSGEGQVVLLSGEPGIGKSRILRELRARLEKEQVASLRFQQAKRFDERPQPQTKRATAAPVKPAELPKTEAVSPLLALPAPVSRPTRGLAPDVVNGCPPISAQRPQRGMQCFDCGSTHWWRPTVSPTEAAWRCVQCFPAPTLNCVFVDTAMASRPVMTRR